jgi:nitrate reductase alpha subunit
MDHPWYIDFGEHFPTYKPKLDPHLTGDIVNSPVDDKALILNYITPHGKWHIHSTYYDNLRMLTLSRGMEPCWINDKDAAKIGIVDNQWVEVYNDNGVMVTRAAVSARVQPGTCMIYHSPGGQSPCLSHRCAADDVQAGTTASRVRASTRFSWPGAMGNGRTDSTTGAPSESSLVTRTFVCVP